MNTDNVDIYVRANIRGARADGIILTGKNPCSALVRYYGLIGWWFEVWNDGSVLSRESVCCNCRALLSWRLQLSHSTVDVKYHQSHMKSLQ